jgi:DNA modification methylase
MNKTVSQLGDIWNLGKHRLLCGDATDNTAINKLMGGEKASLLFTSPPYGNQRSYKIGTIDWTTLMCGVCKNIPYKNDTQVLINLGLIHRDNEWQPYWEEWLKWMPANSWRRFGLYVWDQGSGLPGDWNGRLAPAFEFIFHFNKEAKQPNKIIKCSSAGKAVPIDKRGGLRKNNGLDAERWTHAGVPVQEWRIPDSIIHINRQATSGIEREHPAVFPVPFPEFIIRTYSNEGEIVYEPFAGSGSTIIAAENTNRRCYAVELSPEYVDVIIRRYQRMFEGQEATLECKEVSIGGTRVVQPTFKEVARLKGIELPNDKELYRPETGTKRKDPINVLSDFI